jgi:hypothetical protein
VEYVNGIDIIKWLGLGRKDEQIILPIRKPKILKDLENLISKCDVIGVGAFVYGCSPGPGLF